MICMSHSECTLAALFYMSSSSQEHRMAYTRLEEDWGYEKIWRKIEEKMHSPHDINGLCIQVN